MRVRARRPTDVVLLDAHALQMSAVTVAGTPVAFRTEAHRLYLRTPAPLRAGEGLTQHATWRAVVDRNVPRFAAGVVWAGYQASAWMAVSRVHTNAKRRNARAQFIA
jgi:hypothetical protein